MASAKAGGAVIPLDDFGAGAIAVIPRLRRYARALTGDTARADDLVQDTLERALVKRHLWRSGSDLRAWMFTIMHNVFVNQVRSQIAESNAAQDADTLALDRANTPAHASPLDMLEVADIDAAIRRLPGEQREVLLLVAIEQMSYAEAARVLEIPIGTVMSRLHRARERVRVILGGELAAGVLKVVK